MKVVMQRADGDCSLAALAMLTEQSYEDVYLAASWVEKKQRGKSGLTFPHIRRVAAELGATLRQRKKRICLDEHEGLLVVQWQETEAAGEYHAVILFNGTIIDPGDGEFEDAETFLTKYHCVAVTLFELA